MSESVPEASSSASGSSSPSTFGGPAKPAAAPAPGSRRPNRWRFPSAGGEKVFGALEEASAAPTATHELIEMFAPEAGDGGPVRIVVFSPGWNQPPFPLWVSQAEFRRLAGVGLPVPALMEATSSPGVTRRSGRPRSKDRLAPPMYGRG